MEREIQLDPGLHMWQREETSRTLVTRWDDDDNNTMEQSRDGNIVSGRVREKEILASRKAGVSCKEKKKNENKMSSKRGTLTWCWKRRRSGSSSTEGTVSTCAWGQTTGRHARGRLWFTHPNATLKSHLDVCFYLLLHFGNHITPAIRSNNWTGETSH